ncbi:MAG: hypothetical protein RL238_1458 [Actinomycetota bacterium]|jgi:dihydrofolate reductase
MGKLVVFAGMSVDGVFEAPDGDISWHRVDETVHQHFNEVLFASAAVLGGRVNHEMMNEYWPTADDDPDAAPAIREFAEFWRTVKKYVVTRTMADTGEWNTTVLRSFDPDAIRAIADAADGDVIVGGGEIIDLARRADLVDEWRIYVHPVIVGAGRRLLLDGPGTSLTLTETRSFPNGVVLLRYAVERAEG